MIIVRVMGGTGNQMFQYALARKLKEMNKYVVLDISAYKTWEFRYDFCLNRIFDINKDIYITEDPNEFIIKNCRNIKIIDCENQPYYNADILNYDNVYLNGYWMSEKYFKDIEKILRKEFIFKNTLDKEKSELVNELKNTNSVGIHVRRGGYLQGNAANIFTGITTKKYYDNSLKYIKEKVSNPQFYVFTDDREWAKETFKNTSVKVIDVAIDKTNYTNIQIMSSCKHNILANSTASWWAAWLNNNKNKIIITPDIWLNQKEANMDDIVPHDWIRISHI